MKKAVLLIALSLIGAILLYAYQPNKNEHIRFGMPSKKGLLLNRKGFVELYDTDKKQPLWVSYHLNKQYLSNPIKPVFSFRPDPKLLSVQRAEMADYAGMYSRCRMAALKDMSRSKDIMKECFYLSNVCPMEQNLYAGRWVELEETTRKFVLKGNDAWVITGPVFRPGEGKKPVVKKIGQGKIWVPTHFYKIIFYQGTDGSFTALGFLFENKNQAGTVRDYAAPVSQIEKMTGFNFFSLLPDEVSALIKSGAPVKEKMDEFLGS